MAAPSPQTWPSRRASNGRTTAAGVSCLGDTIPMAERRVKSNGCNWELAPPAIMTSAAPRWITQAASFTARRLEISA